MNLFYLHLRNGERVAHKSAREMVESLGSDLPEFESDVDRQSLIRVWVATKFRPVAQAKSISEYPLAAVINIGEKERDFLYGNRHDIPVEEWLTLPPLVVVCPPEKAPESTQVDGEETVWVLDTTDDETLLESLRQHGALVWSKS